MSFINTQRKQLIVTPKVQYKVIFLISLSVLIPAIMLGAAVYYNLSALHDMATSSAEGLVMALEQTLSRTSMILIMGLPAIVFLIIIWSVVITNRIVGPIYRLEKDLDEIIATRKIKEINFRKEDAFQSLADKINTLLKGVYGDKVSETKFLKDEQHESNT